MKLQIFICLLVIGPTVLAEDTHELQMALYKKHRLLKHEEGKKWSKMRDECRKKYPNWINTSSPDYDGEFNCREEVADAEKAFNDKLQDELCQNIPTLCRK